MPQQKKKSGGCKKKRRVHAFTEPKRRKVHTIKRPHICPACKRRVRVNKTKHIAWHRSGAYHHKWCNRSATRLT